jgi:hypothetical protein
MELTIKTDKLKRTCNEVIMAYFEVLLRHLPEVNKVNETVKEMSGSRFEHEPPQYKVHCAF